MVIKMIIDELRKKLHDSIKNKGINNKETYELSVTLDKEIEKYYKNILQNKN